jgi:hypothetical protein
MLESLKIIVLCIVAAIVYGILHDQVTARVCVEYFTIGHPPIFGTDDPTLLGIGWGIVATWWVGLILGILLAASARLGSLPKLTARELVRSIVLFLAALGILAGIFGVLGYALASHKIVWLPEPLKTRVSEDRRVVFLADLWAHIASYVFGFLGAPIVCIAVIVRRWRRGWQTDRSAAQYSR